MDLVTTKAPALSLFPVLFQTDPMKRPSTSFLLTVACIFLLAGFYRFGRQIWAPFKANLSGQNTVASVVAELEPLMRERFPDLGGLTDGEPIAVLAFKEERRLELWKSRGEKWEHIKDYTFTGFSGKTGPKLREGDLQIPEGVYRISLLNPNSSYHLSLQVDYPNAFDRKMAAKDGRDQLGGDIFIHGMSVTIGCIPLGNPNIEEVFYLFGKNGIKNSRVIIAPYDMRRRAENPSIDGIDWEETLYESIRVALVPFENKR